MKFNLQKRILVVAHDCALQESRVAILRTRGYDVESVDTDDHAMQMLGLDRFDLVLLGRQSLIPKTGVDQRLREAYPEMLILKIEKCGDQSVYASRSTASRPEDVLQAIREMLQ